MSYKRLGDYIELVDERNTNIEIDLLLGLTISKKFIPSVANTIGSNMSNYKIIRKGQFACSIMQVSRDGKIPIALLEDYNEAIISPAYPIFKITDEKKLLPQYLMMWFSREEFDRKATFYAIGGVRGSLDWDDFMNFELPVPDIEKQRAIVKEYQTVTNRIALNETLNQKLEETAQALYKHWFVDIEFPNQYGKPYKSSGGAMVYNEELDKEIPEGWEVKRLGDLCKIQIGRTPPRNQEQWFTSNNRGVKWVSIKDLGENGSHIIETSEELTIEAIKEFNIPIIPKGTTILSFKMSVGKVGITTEEMLSNEAIAHIIPSTKLLISKEHIYCFLKEFNFDSLGTTSSIVNSINSKIVKELRFLYPKEEEIQIKLNSNLEKLFGSKYYIEKQNKLLKELQAVLLSKMSKVG